MASKIREVVSSISGVAALETLLVLPLQIFMLCAIAQITHFIIAYQFTNYAAFAAARAVLVEDTQAMRAGVEFSTDDRAWKAAAHACSPMEIFSPDTGDWIDLPTGGRFRDGTYDELGTNLVKVTLKKYESRPDGSLEVEVAYAVNLPVPFVNQVIYEAFKRRGDAHSGHGTRIWLVQTVALAKPWE